MTMRQIAAVVILALMCGCMDAAPYAGINGPTGRASDAGKLTPVSVRAMWRYELKPASQKLVAKKLDYSDSAKFDDFVHYDGFYDSTLNVTRVAVYGNVTTTSDYGSTYVHGYYVIWEQEGRVKADELPPWQIVDLEIMNQPY
jgi:hypothetical protein